MPRITYAEAARQAILEEIRSDPRVFVMGEDVQRYPYEDVVEELGRERIRSTPISEAGFFGAGIGAALTGMRPVIEGAFSTFLYSAMDQIANQAAKSRYMFGGQASVPLVMRATVSYGIATAAHHSDRPWAIFAQIPGLKIIIPSTPFDAKGLLKSAIRDRNPVLCFDDWSLLGTAGEVPEGDYTVPLGVAEVKRSGTDLTIVALAAAVHRSLEAAEMLAKEGISADVVDLRTVVPMDRQTVIASVAKTGRLLVVDPAPGTCSVASEVAATVAQSAFEFLKGPIVRLTAPDVPVPFSPDLERLMYPTAEGIAAAARTLCRSHKIKTAMPLL
ncbi:pyruvate dehydrogenase subunit beta [Steroidobacter agaridevorans]|uniref:Branched-chain alpha-keto acid dehydrogenase E1 component beta chain n=1 Tax=Steroidobacter agaridevorans TaxID=2695856 RepID=A0A829Y8N2_9GAMM|nr:alpha-ketoacid dehydrogenase subunit beta [Steroidobacter agaridevorans]GFE79664.1 pyruvate dehydrogenase subunit beta [Steroidobacter agaridevorans]GFE90794.1 pyruvate dehydrogenase subunit beta [Steroidobacter agaridevorans]